MFDKIISRIVPRAVAFTYSNFRILSKLHGQFKSMQRWECIDADDRPIPWYSYPAIEYIKQLDLSQKTIFEYGSGNSTRFWAERCRNLVSVEDDRAWYDRLAAGLPANTEYRLIESRQDYVKFICEYPKDFDVVVIDGSHRYDCAVEAVGKLRDDGFIILDNSDWHEKTSKYLRDADLIEVDMCGFGPINGYTWTTSFFFRRNVKLSPGHECQPVHGIGSLHHRECD